MKSFSDKTNIGENNPLKTIYRMNFYLLFLLIGSLSILGSTRAYCQQSRTISGIVKTLKERRLSERISLKRYQQRDDYECRRTVHTAHIAQCNIKGILYGIHGTGSQYT